MFQHILWLVHDSQLTVGGLLCALKYYIVQSYHTVTSVVDRDQISNGAYGAFTVFSFVSHTTYRRYT